MLTPKTINFIQQILVTCSTTYSNGNHYKILLNNHTSVFSEKPWTLLETFESPPSNCANLVLDSYEDYNKSRSSVDQCRLELNVVLLHSNTFELKRQIKKHPPSYEVHLVQVVNNTVQGHYWHKPIGLNSRAVSRHITVSHNAFKPYVIKQEPFPEGSDIELMHELSESLGFTVSYIRATSFNHLVKLVADHKADMSVSNAGGNWHRYRLGTDFFALMYRRYVLVYRYPIPIHSVYTVTLPFNLAVWIGIVASVLVIMMTLTLLSKWYGSKEWLCLSDMSVSYVPLLSASVPHSWYSSHVNKSPYFIIYFTWLLLGTVLSLSYSSNLLANLVKVELEFIPQTLQDVLDMKVGVYVVKNSFIPKSLQESPLEVHQRIYSEAITKRGGYYTGSVMPPEEITNRILSGQQMAVMTDDNQAAFMHKFSMVKVNVNSGPCGYYFRPNLPIKMEIMKALMRLGEAGVIQKIISRTKWKLSLPWRELQRTKPENQTVVIGLTHLVPLFILLLLGLVLGFIITVFETKMSETSQQVRSDVFMNKFATPVKKRLYNCYSIICMNIKRLRLIISHFKKPSNVAVVGDCQ